MDWISTRYVAIYRRNNSSIYMRTYQLTKDIQVLNMKTLGERQKSFLKIFEEQGIEGITRFARHHKKQYMETSALARELRS
jgi:hypothetical protein